MAWALVAALEGRLLGCSDTLLRSRKGRRAALNEIASAKARRLVSEALAESEVTLLHRAGTQLTAEVLGVIGVSHTDEGVERRTYG